MYLYILMSHDTIHTLATFETDGLGGEIDIQYISMDKVCFLRGARISSQFITQEDRHPGSLHGNLRFIHAEIKDDQAGGHTHGWSRQASDPPHAPHEARRKRACSCRAASATGSR